MLLKNNKIYQRILSGWGILFSSNVVGSVIGFAVIALVAKSVSVEEFGILGIIQSYALTVGTLLNFQTWQTIVKYYPKVNEDPGLVKSLLKLSFLLDLITAIIAFIVGLFLLEFLYKIIQVPIEHKDCAQVYLLTILTKLNGTATGYLRVRDRYTHFFKAKLYSGIIKLIIVLIIFLSDLGFIHIVMAFVIGELLHDLILNYNLFQILKEDNLHRFYRSKIKLIRSKFKDIIEFSIHSNLTSSFDMIVLQADVMIVSSFFGVTYAGCFKMIKVIGNLITRLTGPISIIISPIISELIAEDKIKELRKTFLKSLLYFALAFSGAYLCFLIVDDLLVRLIFGEEYLQYMYFLDFAIFNLFVSLCFMAIHPLTNFLGFHKEILYVIIVTSILYLMFIYLFNGVLGFEVIFIAQLIQILMVVIAKFIMINRKLKLLTIHQIRSVLKA